MRTDLHGRRARDTLLLTCRAFYLPGVAPRTFRYGDKVELKVNKLTSVHTQIPYDYYSLKFCRPRGGIKQATENLGEFLSVGTSSIRNVAMRRYRGWSLFHGAGPVLQGPHREQVPLVYGERCGQLSKPRL